MDTEREDRYDKFGRNLTKQGIRQAQVPWVKVRYTKGPRNPRLWIHPEKKAILKSLGLLN